MLLLATKPSFIVDTHHLDLVEARRIAVRSQLLDAPRPTDLVEMVRRLTLVQIDPTAAIAPTADLVAWSRLGSSYRPEHMTAALEDDRTLFEHDALIRPMTDLGLFLAEMAAWPTREGARRWLDDNESFRRDILDRLGASGPLLSRDIADTSVVPWGSSGWTNNRNVTQMLEFLMKRREVAIVGRQGRQRLWDLANRVYPEVEVVPADEARRMRDERRIQSLGIARAKTPAAPIEPNHVGEAGEPAMIEGVAGTWRVDPAALGQPFSGRTALLSPFDRLLHNRVRAQELFNFEYVLEMYKPKEQRRWGYYALPVLHQDTLVGKVDATADRKTGVLHVHAVHQDVQFTSTVTEAVNAELADLASWLGLTLER